MLYERIPTSDSDVDWSEGRWRGFKNCVKRGCGEKPSLYMGGWVAPEGLDLGHATSYDSTRTA